MYNQRRRFLSLARTRERCAAMIDTSIFVCIAVLAWRNAVSLVFAASLAGSLVGVRISTWRRARSWLAGGALSALLGILVRARPPGGVR